MHQLQPVGINSGKASLIGGYVVDRRGDEVTEPQAGIHPKSKRALNSAATKALRPPQGRAPRSRHARRSQPGAGGGRCQEPGAGALGIPLAAVANQAVLLEAGCGVIGSEGPPCLFLGSLADARRVRHRLHTWLTACGSSAVPRVAAVVSLVPPRGGWYRQSWTCRFCRCISGGSAGG